MLTRNCKKNEINKHGATVCVLVLLHMLAIPSSHASSSDQLKVDVALQQPKANQYVLHVTLKNSGATTLSTLRHRLPWGNTYSLLVVAATEGGKLPNESFLIDDPTFVEIQIKPGEILEGDVPLNLRFRDLPDEVTKHDVIIFWSYRMQLQNGNYLERFGGWLLIPKVIAHGKAN